MADVTYYWVMDTRPLELTWKSTFDDIKYFSFLYAWNILGGSRAMSVI